VCVVEGFADRSDALRFEFAWRHTHRRLARRGGPRYDVAGRCVALEALLRRRPPTAAALTLASAQS